MMESFLRTGDWFSESGVQRVDTFTLPRRYYSLINMVGWALVILIPMIYYLTKLITSGSTLYVSIGITVILLSEYFIAISYCILLHK